MTTLSRLDKAARDRAEGEAASREALAAAVAQRQAAVDALAAADAEFVRVLLAVHAAGVLKSKEMEDIVGTKRRATMYRILSNADKAAK